MTSSWALPVRAGAMVSVSTCATITAVTQSAVAVAARLADKSFWSAAGTLGEGVVADAGWLLPLLFGAVIAILALLLGQSLTGTDVDDDQDTRRRRLAASCLLLAGAAMAVLSTAVVGAVGRGDILPRLWSISIAVALVVGSSLWLATVVFGPLQQQFRILGHTLADLDAQRSRLPVHSARRSPVLRFAAAVGSSAVTATVLAVLGFAATSEAAEAETSLWTPTFIAAITGLALLIAVLGSAFALMTAYIDSSFAQPAVGRITAVCYAAVSLGWPAFGLAFGSAGDTRPAVVVLCLTAYLIPLMLAVAIPRRSRSVLSLRAAVDGVRLRALHRRSIRVRADRVALSRAIESDPGSAFR